MITGAILTSFSTSYITLFGGVCTMAFALGAVAPLIATMVAKRWHQNDFSRVMGIIHGVAAAAGIGPLIAGYVRDTTQSYTVAFLGLALILPIALIAFLALPKPVEQTQCVEATTTS